MSSSPAFDQRQALIGFGSNYFWALGDESSAEDILLRHKPPSASSVSNKSAKRKTKKEKEGTAEEMLGFVSARRLTSCGDWDGENSVIEQVACSSTSSIFRTSSGRVYQCGTLHGRQWTSPRRVEIQLPLKCVELAAGRHFCLGRMEGGVGVVSWGAGHFGQLGQDQISELATPQLIPRLLPQSLHSDRVASIAAGTWHAVALLESGSCWTWGSNRHGQCSGTKPHSKSHPPTFVVPTPMETSLKFSQAACGKFHTIGLQRGTGKVYGWGSNHYGQCGQTLRLNSSRSYRRQHGIQLVESLQRVVIVQVRAGDLHTLALTGGGRVFAWGCGMEGQLGVVVQNSIVPKARPKLVGDLDFIAIEAGQFGRKPTSQPSTPPTSGNRASSAQEKSFSESSRDLLKTGAPPTSTVAASQQNGMHPLSNVPRIISIEARGMSSVAVSSTGHVYAWGSNDSDFLGLPTPKKLPIVDPLSPEYQESASSSSSSSRNDRRTLEVASFDSKHNVWLPRRVDALTSGYVIEGVSVGSSHLWCWGYPCRERTEVGRTLYEIHEERRRNGQEQPHEQTRSTEFRRSMGDGSGLDVLRATSSPASTEITLANESMTTTASTSTTAVGSSPPEARPRTPLPSTGNEEGATVQATPSKTDIPSRNSIRRGISLKKVMRKLKIKSPKDSDDNRRVATEDPGSKTPSPRA